MRYAKQEGWKSQLGRAADRGAVVVVTMDERGRVALVFDTKKDGVNGKPAFWKFPGGKVDSSDVDVRFAALRELEEETGLRPRAERFAQVTSIDKGNHELHVFVALVDDFADLRATGDEGEIVRAFSIEQIRNMENFFPNHRAILETVEQFIRHSSVG